MGLCYEYRRLRYLTFDISWWKRHTNNSSTNIPRFIMPVISTVEKCLSRGESVLVHCLAGAHSNKKNHSCMSVAHKHRAGTTGTMLLMHLQGRDSGSALQEARLKRSIINPIGDFPEFLKKCDTLPRDNQGKFLFPSTG